MQTALSDSNVSTKKKKPLSSFFSFFYPEASLAYCKGVQESESQTGGRLGRPLKKILEPSINWPQTDRKMILNQLSGNF